MRLQIFCAFVIGVMEIASAQTSSTPAPVRQAPDPQSLVLVGDRFRPLKYDEMTREQKTMIDHLLAGERQGARGPFNVLLRSPEVGDLAQQFGGSMRFHTALPKDVSETIIIMTGRFWMAQYEWTAHKAAALQNGVKPAIVDAIATGKRPAGNVAADGGGLQLHRRAAHHAPGDRRHVPSRQGYIWREGCRRHDGFERVVLPGFDGAQCGPLSFGPGCATRTETARKSASCGGDGLRDPSSGHNVFGELPNRRLTARRSVCAATASGRSRTNK